MVPPAAIASETVAASEPHAESAAPALTAEHSVQPSSDLDAPPGSCVTPSPTPAPQLLGELVSTPAPTKEKAVFDEGLATSTEQDGPAQELVDGPELGDRQQSVMQARRKAFAAELRGEIYKSALEWMADNVTEENTAWTRFSEASSSARGTVLAARMSDPRLLSAHLAEKRRLVIKADPLRHSEVLHEHTDSFRCWCEARSAYVHAIGLCSSANALASYSQEGIDRWMAAQVELSREAVRAIATWQVRAERELTRVLELVQGWHDGTKDEHEYPALPIYGHIKLVGDVIYHEMRRNEDLASGAAARVRQLTRRMSTAVLEDIALKELVWEHRGNAVHNADEEVRAGRLCPLLAGLSKIASTMVEEVLQASQFYSDSFLPRDSQAQLANADRRGEGWHALAAGQCQQLLRVKLLLSCGF